MDFRAHQQALDELKRAIGIKEAAEEAIEEAYKKLGYMTKSSAEALATQRARPARSTSPPSSGAHSEGQTKRHAAQAQGHCGGKSEQQPHAAKEDDDSSTSHQSDDSRRCSGGPSYSRRFPDPEDPRLAPFVPRFY